MPFSKHDDVKLYEGLKEYGQKWTIISKEFFMNQRSDIQLKNRFKTKSFQQFYNKVVNRAMDILRWQKLNGGVGADVSLKQKQVNADDDAETGGLVTRRGGLVT